MKILYLEPSVVIRKCTTVWLHEYDVLIAEEGEQAKRYLENEIALAVVDDVPGLKTEDIVDCLRDNGYAGQIVYTGERALRHPQSKEVIPTESKRVDEISDLVKKLLSVEH